MNLSLPVNSVKEFIAYANANPGKVNFSHAGVGSSMSLSGEFFKLQASVVLVFIPYKGTGPALAAVLGDEVQSMFPNTQAAVSLIKGGEMPALGVTSAAADPLLPGVPTIARETGGSYVLKTWFGLFAPAKTLDRLVDALNADVNKMYERRK